MNTQWGIFFLNSAKLPGNILITCGEKVDLWIIFPSVKIIVKN